MAPTEVETPGTITLPWQRYFTDVIKVKGLKNKGIFLDHPGGPNLNHESLTNKKLSLAGVREMWQRTNGRDLKCERDSTPPCWSSHIETMKKHMGNWEGQLLADRQPRDSGLSTIAAKNLADNPNEFKKDSSPEPSETLHKTRLSCVILGLLTHRSLG